MRRTNCQATKLPASASPNVVLFTVIARWQQFEVRVGRRVQITCGVKAPIDLHDIRQPRVASSFYFIIRGEATPSHESAVIGHHLKVKRSSELISIATCSISCIKQPLPEFLERGCQEYLAPQVPPPLQCSTRHPQVQLQFVNQSVRNPGLHPTQQNHDTPQDRPVARERAPILELFAICFCRNKNSGALSGPSSPIPMTHLSVCESSKRCEERHHTNCNPAAAPDLPSLSQWLINTERNWDSAKHGWSWVNPGELVATHSGD